MKAYYRLYLLIGLFFLGVSNKSYSVENTSQTPFPNPAANITSDWSNLPSSSSYSLFPSPVSSALPYESLVEEIITLGKRFLGKPYRYRASKQWIMDCSGFVGYIFSHFDIKLPRSSSAMSQYTVSVKNPQPGDLLFFKGRNSRSSRVGHVAMVVSVDGNDITMIHSSCQKGIVIEKMKRSAYFSKRYLGAGRVPQLHTMKLDTGKESDKEKNEKDLTIKPSPFQLTPIAPLSLPESFSHTELLPPLRNK